MGVWWGPVWSGPLPCTFKIESRERIVDAVEKAKRIANYVRSIEDRRVHDEILRVEAGAFWLCYAAAKGWCTLRDGGVEIVEAAYYDLRKGWESAPLLPSGVVVPPWEG